MHTHGLTPTHTVIQFFQLDVLYECPDGTMAVSPSSHIIQQLHNIMKMSSDLSECPVGILTSEHRDSWAKSRERLVAGQQKHLHMYISVCICISQLECGSRLTSQSQGEGTTYLVAQFWHCCHLMTDRIISFNMLTSLVCLFPDSHGCFLAYRYMYIYIYMY